MLRIEDAYTNSNPADANYPEGSFKNSTTSVSLDGTPLEKGWCNDLQGFIQTLVDKQSITPSGSADTILVGDIYDALSEFLIKPGYAVQAGTGAAYVLTTKERITAYSNGMRIPFRAINASIAGATANVSGIGAKNIVLPGRLAIRDNDIVVGDYVVLIYDTANDELVYENFDKNKAISIDQYKNLVIVPGADPDADIDFNADELILKNTGGAQITIFDVDETINTIDTGGIAADTEYFIWMFLNPSTGDVLGRYSLSSINPTAPGAGYTFKSLYGSIFTDGDSDFIPIKQTDNYVEYVVAQTVKDNAFTADAWTAQPVGGIISSLAKRSLFLMAGNANPTHLGVAPESTGQGGDRFGAATSGGASTLGGVLPTAREAFSDFEIRHQNTIYYWTRGATSTLMATGWKY